MLSTPQLADDINGRIITPDDADYDQARRVFMGAIDRRPAMIVRVADAADVSRVITLARETGTELAVRGGGHSPAGHGVSEGGIVLDLSAMRAIEIDAERRTAWAETGLTAGEYTAAAGAHGLATGFGDAGSVGIGGITLSGGIGFLVRKHGMTIDDLLAAEVVTADGRLLRVDAEHHPDLFWAIRGGGGNFGVATRLQFRLHEVDTIVGGMLFLPASPEVLAAFIAEAEAAPEELSTIANVMPAPPLPFLAPEHHGRLVVMAMLVYAGDLEAGERAVAPFRALATPVADMVRPMPYPEMYPPADESYRPVAVARTTVHRQRRAADRGDRSSPGSSARPRRCASPSSASSAARWRACRRTRPRSPTATAASWPTSSRCTRSPRSAPEHEAWVDRPRERAEPGRPGRLRGLPRRRGRGARPRRLPGRHVGAAGGREGRLRPGEPLPAQPEHPAGRGVVRPAAAGPRRWRGRVGTDHPGSQRDAERVVARGIPDRPRSGGERARAEGARCRVDEASTDAKGTSSRVGAERAFA